MKTESSGTLLIAGCGVSGRAAARLAARLGLPFALLDEQDNDSLRAVAASLPKQPETVYIVRIMISVKDASSFLRLICTIG